MPSSKDHQQQPMNPNYNPAAIESWRKEVSKNDALKTTSLQDPAIQAYMAAKLGLFQQEANNKKNK